MPPPFYFTAAWRRRVERKGGGETLGEGRKGPRVPFPVHSHSHSPEGPAKPAALVQEERRKRLAGFKGGRGGGREAGLVGPPSCTLNRVANWISRKTLFLDKVASLLKYHRRIFLISPQFICGKPRLCNVPIFSPVPSLSLHPFREKPDRPPLTLHPIPSPPPY